MTVLSIKSVWKWEINIIFQMLIGKCVPHYNEINTSSFDFLNQFNYYIARTQRQPPAILSSTPQLASVPLWPQMGLVMAGCWQNNSILANIGRRKSIRILNQYPFWNVLIWAQFIRILKLVAF